MSIPEGSEPIADDELLFRRIPGSQGWFDPDADVPVSPEAFRPTQADTSGLSLWRAKYKSIEEAAQGREGKKYYVAVLRAGDLRAKGIEVTADPELPGHAEISGLTYEDRKSDQCLEWKIALAQELCVRVEGPFPSP